MQTAPNTSQCVTPSTSPRELLSKKQVAQRLSISTRTLDEWMRSRRLPYLKIGKTVRFSWETVVSHFAERYQIGQSVEGRIA